MNRHFHMSNMSTYLHNMHHYIYKNTYIHRSIHPFILVATTRLSMISTTMRSSELALVATTCFAFPAETRRYIIKTRTHTHTKHKHTHTDTHTHARSTQLYAVVKGYHNGFPVQLWSMEKNSRNSLVWNVARVASHGVCVFVCVSS